MKSFFLNKWRNVPIQDRFTELTVKDRINIVKETCTNPEKVNLIMKP